MTAVRQAFVLFVNLLKFPCYRRKLVQLFKLILQQLTAGFPLLRLLLMLRQRAAALVPCLIGCPHLNEQVVMTGVGIQQVLLMIGFEQQLMGMLTVDLDQQLAQIA